MNFKLTNFVANGAIGKRNLDDLFLVAFLDMIQVFHQWYVVFLVLQSSTQLRMML